MCQVMTMAPAASLLKKARAGLAGLCLGVLLMVQAMAAAPALHELVHSDSANPAHQCVVTLFVHGQVHCSSVAVEVSQFVPCFSCRQERPGVVFISADVQLLSCRGPPALLV